MDADLSLSQDVAGATFMALATCTPELFTNLIGTFITDSDLGVGTVVGSAVFNTLGVPACGGLTASIVRTTFTIELLYRVDYREPDVFETCSTSKDY